MMNATTRLFTPLAILAGLILASSAMAQSAVQERLKDRAPELDALLTALVVGEANTGYIVARESLSSAQKALVNAENSDRKELYQAVARKVGKSVPEIAAARATIIREKAAKARTKIWVQMPDGSWTKE